MYTDETILTFGRYKFTRLCRVPPEYLLTFLHDNHTSRELHEYVNANHERSIARKKGVVPTPQLERPCEKIMYYSIKEAKERLRVISNQPQFHKKPIRAYECGCCGGWHLTSIPLDDWKKLNQIK